MSTDSKIWYWAHFAMTVAVAAVLVLTIGLLIANSNLLLFTFHGPIVLVFVMPGALLVFAINHLILWRRKPRDIRVGDKVVIVIVAVLTVVTFASSFSDDPGILVAFISVPLLIIAGIASTIVIAVGNARGPDTPLQVAPVVPGTAPVAATLDELFTEQPAATPPAAAADVAADPEATPYGPKP